MSETPVVTVLVPARDEALSITRCLERVLEQDFPADQMEIIVVDGNSSDGTASLAREILRKRGTRWSVVPNENATTPSNLNAGLTIAKGRFVCRVDARSLIPPHYVRSCIEVLREREDVIVVGGAQVAIARDATPRSKGIARALNNRYLMGGSRYRSLARSGATETVYLGAFRRADLVAAGGWDERFPTNQDFELNRRLAKIGLVWFDHRLRVEYLPRDSMAGLFDQYRRFGRWKVRYWRVTDDRPLPRQTVILGSAFAGTIVLLDQVRRSRRRDRLLTRAAVGAAASLSLLDLSSNGARVSLRTHVRACQANALVASGWLLGVSLEASAVAAKVAAAGARGYGRR